MVDKMNLTKGAGMIMVVVHIPLTITLMMFPYEEYTLFENLFVLLALYAPLPIIYFWFMPWFQRKMEQRKLNYELAEDDMKEEHVCEEKGKLW